MPWKYIKPTDKARVQNHLQKLLSFTEDTKSFTEGERKLFLNTSFNSLLKQLFSFGLKICQMGCAFILIMIFKKSPALMMRECRSLPGACETEGGQPCKNNCPIQIH